MKEKGLVAGDLFVEARVNELLQDYDRGTGDSYYRAYCKTCSSLP